ncbi:MAG: ankyrin repeat domain-containing protein [Patescibacteria group bacterium]|nr:ankyrin repeat domain-containing protein [Patescibacteria group bacterium]
MNYVAILGSRAHLTHTRTAEDAACTGRVDMLNRLVPSEEINIFGNRLFKRAAEHNRLNVILWLMRRGNACPSVGCSRAARGGHLPLLRWLVKKEVPLHDTKVVDNAIRGGHIGILKWVLGRGPPQDLDILCRDAAGYGHLEIIKWLQGRGGHITSIALSFAIRRGHQHVIDYMLPICPPNEDVVMTAAEIGDLKLLKRLVEHKYPVDSRAATMAAGYGRLDVLRWLVENKYPLNTQVCRWGRHNSLVLQFLKAFQCPCGGEYHEL